MHILLYLVLLLNIKRYNANVITFKLILPSSWLQGFKMRKKVKVKLEMRPLFLVIRVNKIC